MEQGKTQEILTTGIKVVDLLAPYAKGGKIGLFGGAGVESLFDMRGLMHRNLYPFGGVEPNEPGHDISARMDLYPLVGFCVSPFLLPYTLSSLVLPFLLPYKCSSFQDGL